MLDSWQEALVSNTGPRGCLNALREEGAAENNQRLIWGKAKGIKGRERKWAYQNKSRDLEVPDHTQLRAAEVSSYVIV